LRFKTRDLALLCVFSALYVLFSFVSLFPVIGSVGMFITLASILAPLIGILLGPYVGAMAVTIGGFLGWSITQTGAFGFVSFVPGACTAFASGLLYDGKRIPYVFMYVLLFLTMALYPTIGPAWLYPYYLWFQLIGLVVLASPLASIAVNFIRSDSFARLTFGLGIISLMATLIGQIAGSLMFEFTRWPIIYPQIEYWRIAQWQFLTFIYPLERGIISFLAMLIGTPLIKALRAYGFKVGGT
jgi:uncharacterized membrane protein